MTAIPTLDKLQEFALNFDKEITAPLLAKGYDQCNVFDILNIKRQELRHSDFLAFLFDPNKSGEVGRQFLPNFLARFVKENKTDKIDFYEALYGKIDRLNVSREFVTNDGQIDILIDFEITKDIPKKILIVIENKVDSGQNGNQLERYKNFLTKTAKYQGYEPILLYLTIDKSDPECSGWTPIDYKFIHEVLENIKVKNTTNSIKILIEDYKKLLRSEFMNDSTEESKAALEIYKKHRGILDFIFRCKPDWISKTAELFCNALEKHGAIIATVNSKGELSKTAKRDYANLAFTTNWLYDNYPKHYFQIYVKDLLLVFRKNLTQNQCPQIWLFGNSQQSSDEAKKYQELVIDDPAQLKEKCEQLVDRMFAKDEIIDQCLATLKNDSTKTK